MMAKLIFIRHAEPAIIEGTPAHSWQLSEAGRAACIPLAERVRPFAPAWIALSHEPKAAQTGRIIANRLAIPSVVADGLHEHRRPVLPWFGRAQWEQNIQRFFHNPDQLIMGEETADACHARFAASVARVLDSSAPGETIAIATHGTVITLYLSRRMGFAPSPFWNAIAMPDMFVLDLAKNRLET